MYLPEAKIQALKVLPGARELLAALADQNGVYLVGGAVRDLMLGFVQFDFDLVVESDAGKLADHLAAQLGGSVARHDRFGTATFVATGETLTVDIARARTETYAHPGALPEVTPATLEEDLGRRDFSVNAMAVALWTERFGEVVAFEDAHADLAARILRITHDRSFIDDPTRLLRLLRYGARLGFTAEPLTEERAREAVAAGALSTVSGQRIADELMDLLAERGAVVALESMQALELDVALHPEFEADEYLAARATLQLPEGVRQDLLLLAVGSRKMSEATLMNWLDHLALKQRDRAIVADAVLNHVEVLERVASAASASEVDSVLRRYETETVALAIAMPGGDVDAVQTTREWLAGRRDDHLQITGAELLAAGIPEGPAIGRALASTLALAIDGEVVTRDDQLKHALHFARTDSHAR